MKKMTFFGLKEGRDLENRATHPHQEFPGVPPRPGDSGAKKPRYLHPPKKKNTDKNQTKENIEIPSR